MLLETAFPINSDETRRMVPENVLGPRKDIVTLTKKLQKI
jgi:hypothetical protein